MTSAQGTTGDRPARLVLGDDLERSRVTVFFRILLSLPFLIWLGVWAIAAVFATLVNWVATLVRGQSPTPLHGFLARFVGFATHTYAYLNLATEPLPAFNGKPGYPVDLEIDPPARQNRWTVAFRLVLALPALAIAHRPRRLGRLGLRQLPLEQQRSASPARSASPRSSAGSTRWRGCGCRAACGT